MDVHGSWPRAFSAGREATGAALSYLGRESADPRPPPPLPLMEQRLQQAQMLPRSPLALIFLGRGRLKGVLIGGSQDRWIRDHRWTASGGPEERAPILPLSPQAVAGGNTEPRPGTGCQEEYSSCSAGHWQGQPRRWVWRLMWGVGWLGGVPCGLWGQFLCFQGPELHMGRKPFSSLPSPILLHLNRTHTGTRGHRSPLPHSLFAHSRQDALDGANAHVGGQQSLQPHGQPFHPARSCPDQEKLCSGEPPASEQAQVTGTRVPRETSGRI